MTLEELNTKIDLLMSEIKELQKNPFITSIDETKLLRLNEEYIRLMELKIELINKK